MDSASENAGRDEPRKLGATLSAERERQGLSRAEVAQRLHMSPMQIEALERADYEHLPKGTFLRGFVRNYAKVLGMDAEAVLELLAEAAPRAPAPGIVVPTQNIRFDPLGERFSSPYVKAAALAAVAVAIGFAAMYWAMFIRPTPPAAVAKKTAVESATSLMPPDIGAASGTPPGPLSSTATVAASTAAPQTPAAAPMPAPSAQPPAAAAKATAASADAASKAPEKAKPVAGARTIRFHFQGESWVEVRDARGKVLIQRLNASGSDAEVSGRPPLQVVVGNAPEVQMTYDGQPFDLLPHTNVSVARLTLD